MSDGATEMISERQVGGDHYIKLGIQPWSAFQAWFPASFADFLLMSAMKYLTRKKANKREDVEKAIHCLQKWLECTK